MEGKSNADATRYRLATVNRCRIYTQSAGLPELDIWVTKTGIMGNEVRVLLCSFFSLIIVNYFKNRTIPLTGETLGTILSSWLGTLKSTAVDCFVV
jgi:hypothetical protein